MPQMLGDEALALSKRYVNDRLKEISIGKNLMPQVKNWGINYNQYVRAINDDTFEVTYHSSIVNAIWSPFVKINPNEDYMFSFSKTGYSRWRLHFYDSNQGLIDSVELSNTTTTKLTMTYPFKRADAHYFRWQSYIPAGANYFVPIGNFQLESGTKNTAYDPYSEKSYTKITAKMEARVETIENSTYEGLLTVGTSGYNEDFTFVGDELWRFGASSDGSPGDVGIGNLYIHDNNLLEKKILRHNFGHCNTIDYNKNTDSLIFGNGGNVYSTDGFIHIIQGVAHWRDLAGDTLLDMVGGTIAGSLITSIPVLKTFGSKLNVCWGDWNLGKHNICYVMSNDNKNIRKLLLGLGTNVLENGTLIGGRTANQYNGTYKILGEWAAPDLQVNQGSCYYNGYLYCNLDHNDFWSVRYKLNYDNTVSVEQRREKLYDDSGNLLSIAGAGMAIKDGYIYHGYRLGGIKIYKHRIY